MLAREVGLDEILGDRRQLHFAIGLWRWQQARYDCDRLLHSNVFLQPAAQFFANDDKLIDCLDYTMKAPALERPKLWITPGQRAIKNVFEPLETQQAFERKPNWNQQCVRVFQV